jgi:hypothetical protein
MILFHRPAVSGPDRRGIARLLRLDIRLDGFCCNAHDSDSAFIYVYFTGSGKCSMPIAPLIIEPTSASFPAALKNQENGAAVSRLWAMGPVDLLKKPLLGLFCSAQCPGEVILRIYDLARALRDAGAPVISGFHSPMEKECLDLLLRGSQPVVICPARSIERLSLPTAWRQAVEDGRLLILSPFAGRHRRPTVQLAEQRNDFIAALAGCVVVTYAAPGSKTEQFCQTLLNRHKPVFLLDSAVNESLLELGAWALSIDGIVGLIQAMESGRPPSATPAGARLPLPRR